jgi:predicted kinase
VRGLMGAGKSTLASALAEALSAEHLQTDVLRTELMGKGTQAAAYGEGRYGTENRRRVYDELFAQAQTQLKNGLSVVLDGTFLAAEMRTEAVELARRFGALPLVVECLCPESVALGRITRRRASGKSPSEARPDLLSEQSREEEPNPAGLPTLRVDTTDDIAVQVEAVFLRLSSLTARSS